MLYSRFYFQVASYLLEIVSWGTSQENLLSKRDQSAGRLVSLLVKTVDFRNFKDQ